MKIPGNREKFYLFVCAYFAWGLPGVLVMEGTAVELLGAVSVVGYGVAAALVFRFAAREWLSSIKDETERERQGSPLATFAALAGAPYVIGLVLHH